MAASMPALLRRLEGHLRPGYNQRSSLAKASLETWAICFESLGATYTELSNLFPRQGGGPPGSAAFWVHWRKSCASKQFLALLKAVSEALTSEAAWMPAECMAVGSGNCMSVEDLRCHMAMTWNFAACCLFDPLFSGSNAGTLWPALREWLSDRANLEDLWGSLAWLLAHPAEDPQATRAEAGPTHAMHMIQRLAGVTMMLEKNCPSAILQHPSVVEALRLTFASVLPAAFAATSSRAHDACFSLLHSVIAGLGEAEPQLWKPLHRFALGAWPYLVGALRRQRKEESASSLEVWIW